MKNRLYKIVDYLFYNFFVNVIEENLRVTIFLNAENFNKEISMNYVPVSGSFIKLENGIFEVKKVTHAMFGSVAYLDGKLNIMESVIKNSSPLVTKEMMIDYINSNRDMISKLLDELDQLKANNNKDIWQVKANALIQKVSNNDFRVLKWKEVFGLIRREIKNISQ